MPFNKAIIPLYLNTSILNNLYTIAVEEFIQIKSVSMKDQLLVHLKTPISEFSNDLCGKYIQGDVDLQYTNEFVKQKAEENVATVIVILKKLRDILIEQNLLKFINDAETLNSVREYDFVDFGCELRRNPVIQNVHDVISAMEMRRVFNSYPVDKVETNDEQARRLEMLNFFRNGLASSRQERCIRYIGDNLCDFPARVVIPLKFSNMLEYEDYMLNGRVRVMGKLVKINRFDDNQMNGSSRATYNRCRDISLLSDTHFDNINFDNIYNDSADVINNMLGLNQRASDSLNPVPLLMEILPLVIYI